ncbi:MAG: zinc-binding dehydrogenase [Rhodothermales bacterium]|nr:zinc-binding dehydrogenase [Rhodothermales bacterium]
MGPTSFGRLRYPAAYSFGQCSKVLKTGGSYVATLLSVAMMTGMVRALFSSKHCRFVRVSSKRADLELVGDWLSDGLEVPIDSRHKIADLDAALKRQTNRGRIGRVVVDVSGWQL